MVGEEASLDRPHFHVGATACWIDLDGQYIVALMVFTAVLGDCS